MRILGAEDRETFAEATGIELRNAEDSDAALGAPEAAVQPMTGAPGGVGGSSVHDLDQVLVPVCHVTYPR